MALCPQVGKPMRGSGAHARWLSTGGFQMPNPGPSNLAEPPSLSPPLHVPSGPVGPSSTSLVHGACSKHRTCWGCPPRPPPELWATYLGTSGHSPLPSWPRRSLLHPRLSSQSHGQAPLSLLWAQLLHLVMPSQDSSRRTLRPTVASSHFGTALW